VLPGRLEKVTAALELVSVRLAADPEALKYLD
jgi:hypothetical protein